MSTSRLRSIFGIWPPSGFRAVLEGDLADISVPDVFSLLHRGRRSGLLVFVSGGVERGFAFAEGDILWVRSDEASEDTFPALALGGLLRSGVGGNFTFLRAPTAFAPAGERIPTVRLLLDCLRLIDEGG